jgi:hypothetical protein
MYNRPDLLFESSLGTLRQTLYSQITKLAAIPTTFGNIAFQSGSNEFSDQYAIILLYHMTTIEGLYRRTEVLIDRIANSWQKFNPWVVLWQISDFDEALNWTLTEHANFLTNLHAITCRETEFEKLLDEETFDYIMVLYVAAKNLFRRLMGEYKWSICTFLWKSLDDDISSVMLFINNSLSLIQTTVQPSEEVKRIHETITSINSKMTEVQKVFKTIRDKSSLLMIIDQRSRQSLQFQIDSISSHWLVFQDALVDQSKLVQQQVRTLRTLTNQKMEDFQRRTTIRMWTSRTRLLSIERLRLLRLHGESLQISRKRGRSFWKKNKVLI